MKSPVTKRPLPTTEQSTDSEVMPPVSSSKSLVTRTFLFAFILGFCGGITASMLLVLAYPSIPSDSLLYNGPETAEVSTTAGLEHGMLDKTELSAQKLRYGRAHPIRDKASGINKRGREDRTDVVVRPGSKCWSTRHNS
jgi:hypothetical protein